MLSGFRHIEASIQASRGGSRRHARGRGETTTSRASRVSQEKLVAATEEAKTEDAYTKFPKRAITRKVTIAAIDAALIALEEETTINNNNDDGGEYEDFSDGGFANDLNMQ